MTVERAVRSPEDDAVRDWNTNRWRAAAEREGFSAQEACRLVFWQWIVGRRLKALTGEAWGCGELGD